MSEADDLAEPGVTGGDDEGSGVPVIPIAIAVVAALGLFAYLGNRGRRRTAEDE